MLAPFHYLLTLAHSKTGDTQEVAYRTLQSPSSDHSAQLKEGWAWSDFGEELVMGDYDKKLGFSGEDWEVCASRPMPEVEFLSFPESKRVSQKGGQ